jgi:hypothetical protein
MNLEFLGWDKTQLVLAGAFGGIVRWMTLRDHWTDGLIAIVVGAICSFYLSPLAIPALAPLLSGVQVAPESALGVSGFLMGVGGITAAGFVLDLWRARRRMLKQQPAAEDFTGGEDGDPKP